MYQIIIEKLSFSPSMLPREYLMYFLILPFQLSSQKPQVVPGVTVERMVWHSPFVGYRQKKGLQDSWFIQDSSLTVSPRDLSVWHRQQTLPLPACPSVVFVDVLVCVGATWMAGGQMEPCMVCSAQPTIPDPEIVIEVCIDSNVPRKITSKFVYATCQTIDFTD